MSTTARTSAQIERELKLKRREVVESMKAGGSTDEGMLAVDKLVNELHQTVRDEHRDAVLVAESAYVEAARNACVAYRTLVDAVRAARRVGVVVENSFSFDFSHLRESDLTTSASIEGNLLAWLNGIPMEKTK